VTAVPGLPEEDCGSIHPVARIKKIREITMSRWIFIVLTLLLYGINICMIAKVHPETDDSRFL
jgi:hypothetical protein